MKGFRAWLMRFDTLGLVRTSPAPGPLPEREERGQGAPAARCEGTERTRPPCPAVPKLSTDKDDVLDRRRTSTRAGKEEAKRRSAYKFAQLFV
jgi:hypothetical protein